MIIKNHTFEKKLPECVSEELNYFNVNKTLFKSKMQVVKFVEKQLIKGQHEFYFRLEGRVGLKNVSDTVNDMLRKYCVDNGITNKKIRELKNNSMKSIWIKLE